MKTLVLKTTLLLIAIFTSISATAATYTLKVTIISGDETVTYEKQGVSKHEPIQFDVTGEDQVDFDFSYEHNEQIFFEFSINVHRKTFHDLLDGAPQIDRYTGFGISDAPLGKTTEVIGGKDVSMFILITREEVEAE